MIIEDSEVEFKALFSEESLWDVRPDLTAIHYPPENERSLAPGSIEPAHAKLLITRKFRVNGPTPLGKP